MRLVEGSLTYPKHFAAEYQQLVLRDRQQETVDGTTYAVVVCDFMGRMGALLINQPNKKIIAYIPQGEADPGYRVEAIYSAADVAKVRTAHRQPSSRAGLVRSIEILVNAATV